MGTRRPTGPLPLGNSPRGSRLVQPAGTAPARSGEFPTAAGATGRKSFAGGRGSIGRGVQPNAMRGPSPFSVLSSSIDGPRATLGGSPGLLTSGGAVTGAAGGRDAQRAERRALKGARKRLRNAAKQGGR